jgi:hypothetical protein
MAGEKSCVHPFIRRIQAVLKQTNSLRASLREIRGYQVRVRRVYRVDVHCVHAAAISTSCLASLVIYEYLRHRGLPLPNSRSIIGGLMPFKNRSDEIVTNREQNDNKHERLGREYGSHTPSASRR